MDKRDSKALALKTPIFSRGFGKEINVLFVASELTPLAKVGGLGDVIGSLPKALSGEGVRVGVLIPRYEEIDVKEWRCARVLSNFPVSLGQDTEYVDVYRGVLPVFLLDNNKYLSRGPIYASRSAFVDSEGELKRFLFFSKAAAELFAADYILGGAVFGLGVIHAVHAHDWHTGALVALIKKSFPAQKVIFTIHNLENQGIWSAQGLSSWFGDFSFNRIRGQVNLMAEGITKADMATTVSPTYAKEVLTKKYGAGLERVLARRMKEGKLRGILNGIDYDFWPPLKKDKISFQKKLGLATDTRAPIFGLVSRLTYQKGIDFISPLVEQFARRGAQFVFLGQGEDRHEKNFAALARKNPRQVFSKIGFDEALAHSIYAHSDFFLMPSMFEPSGLGQMIAMRYGSVPIVRETGGLKDTVIHKTTGFVFQAPTPSALSATIEEALLVYRDHRQFKKIIHNCKRQDFSWGVSARKYKHLYGEMFRS